MTRTDDSPQHKHLRLRQSKISRAKRILGAKTETEAIEQALDFVIEEDAKNRAAWSAHSRFLSSTIEGGHEIADAFGGTSKRTSSK